VKLHDVLHVDEEAVEEAEVAEVQFFPGERTVFVGEAVPAAELGIAASMLWSPGTAMRMRRSPRTAHVPATVAGAAPEIPAGG
jgi:hypothetical protein